MRKIDILFPKRLSKTSLTGLRQFLARSRRKIFRRSMSVFDIPLIASLVDIKHNTKHKGAYRARFIQPVYTTSSLRDIPAGEKLKIGLVELSLSLFCDKRHFGGKQVIKKKGLPEAPYS